HKRLLFVCKGNICRSPFAVKYAKKHMPGWYISSARYYPVTGRCSPPEAIQCASEFGIDLHRHYSMGLSLDIVEKADALIVFDLENFAHVIRAHSKAKRKII